MLAWHTRFSLLIFIYICAFAPAIHLNKWYFKRIKDPYNIFRQIANQPAH